MASPSRPSSSLRARRASLNTRLDAAPSVVLANAISYGYAVIVVLAVVQLHVHVTLITAAALVALFVVLRVVARQVRSDARAHIVHEAARRAALRAQSPSRWTVEQRDGLGRRIDAGA